MQFCNYFLCNKFSGELIGLEYLYDQTGRPLQEYDQAIQTMEEKGLPVDRNEEATTIQEDDDITVNLVIDPLPEPAQLVPPVAGRGMLCFLNKAETFSWCFNTKKMYSVHHLQRNPFSAINLLTM